MVRGYGVLIEFANYGENISISFEAFSSTPIRYKFCHYGRKPLKPALWCISTPSNTLLIMNIISYYEGHWIFFAVNDLGKERIEFQLNKIVENNHNTSIL